MEVSDMLRVKEHDLNAGVRSKWLDRPVMDLFPVNKLTSTSSSCPLTFANHMERLLMQGMELEGGR